MPLSQRSRSAIYQGISTVVPDEEAVEEMLSYFPARDVEEPVTKEFLRAEMADLRLEVAGLRLEMADLRLEMSEFRTEIRGELEGFRTETRGDVAGLRQELHDGLRRQTHWLIGVVVALMTLMTTIQGLLR